MKYFSTKVATEQSFCNRQAQRMELVDHIRNNEHSVIVAPRRYGKTSLVMQAIKEVDLAYAQVDMFCVVYEEEVIRKLAKGVSVLMQSLMSRTEKTIAFLEDVFKMATIGFKAGGFDVSVELSRNTMLADHIEDLLCGLEMIAAKAARPVVFFIDEFQDILKIEKSRQIQAAIRSVAQHSQYVTYIFSGSSRSMLEKIFDDSSQPLYMMCHKMNLGRIREAHFLTHIENAFLQHWQQSIDVDMIEHILKLTECHTYYVNALCADIMLKETPLSIEEVNEVWDRQLVKHKAKIIAELQELNSNRLKVLINIALTGRVSEPNSRKFIEDVKLSLSSIQVAIKYLLDHDYIYQDDGKSLSLVDPLMRKFLLERHG
ncbi:MAG: AAA family ATPase [Francisellaceae bacterium]